MHHGFPIQPFRLTPWYPPPGPPRVGSAGANTGGAPAPTSRGCAGPAHNRHYPRPCVTAVDEDAVSSATRGIRGFDASSTIHR